MKNALILLMIPLASLGQNPKTPLMTTSISGITSAWAGECAAMVVDNRSAAYRQNNYHAYSATGTGTWAVDMQWSDTACTGPWTSYGALAQVSQASNPAIGFGNDPAGTYHRYIKFVFSGAGQATVVVTYSASRNYFISAASGAVSFPCSIAQGCTGATTAPAARIALDIFTPADIRYYGATCDGTDQNTAVQAAIAAGVKRIGIPGGCKWQLPLSGGAYLIPGNIAFIGEGITSLITTPDPINDNAVVAPGAVIENMSVRAAGCTGGSQTGGPYAGTDCLVRYHFNYNSVNETFRSTGYTFLQGAVRGDAATQGDYGIINIGTRGRGDAIFVANEDHTTGGAGWGGGNGVHVYQQDSIGMPTAGVRVVKQNTGTAIRIEGGNHASAVGENDFLVNENYRTQGDVFSVQHGTSAWVTGSVYSAVMGQGAGTFTGNFLYYNKDALDRFIVNDLGSVFSNGVVNTNGGYQLGGYALDIPGERMASNYAFTAQSPAVSLTAGVDATITLTPCPRGVNWNDASHSLYITDAVAGGEDVQIKAAGPGTCTSGAASGTLTLTGIGLNHTSGNWSIGSATGGVSEAVIVAVAASGDKTVVVNSTVTLLANTVIPGTVSLRIPKGGGFTCSGSQTVAINASLDTEALHRVFFGNCVVTMTNVSAVYPQWWGATGDGATDDTAAFTAAIAAVGSTSGSEGLVGAGGRTIRVPAGHYVASLTLPSNVALVGDGEVATTFYAPSDGASVIKTTAPSYGIRVEDVGCYINLKQNVTCFDIDSAAQSKFRNLRVTGGADSGPGVITGIGMHIHSSDLTDAHIVMHNEFTNINITQGPTRAMVIGQNAGGRPVTLNAFKSLYLTASNANPNTNAVFDVVGTADTNTVWDLHVAGAHYGVAINSGDPAVENDVAGWIFHHLVGLTSVNVGLAINYSQYIKVFDYECEAAVGTPLSVSADAARYWVDQTTGVWESGVAAQTLNVQGGLRLGTVALGTPLAMPPYPIALGGGTTNDIALGVAGSVIRVTGPVAGFGLGGFAGGVDGRILTVINATAQQMTIVNASGGSAVGNRILTLTGANVVLRAGPSAATFVYSISDASWILVSYN